MRRITATCPGCGSRETFDYQSGDEKAIWQCSGWGRAGKMPPPDNPKDAPE